MHLWPGRREDFRQYCVSSNTIITLHVWISHPGFQNASAFCIALCSCGTNGETEVTELEIKLMSSNSWVFPTLAHSCQVHNRSAKILGVWWTQRCIRLIQYLKLGRAWLFLFAGVVPAGWRGKGQLCAFMPVPCGYLWLCSLCLIMYPHPVPDCFPVGTDLCQIQWWFLC